MIEEQRELCTEIFQKLMALPCARLFWDSDHELINDRIEQPFNFKLIFAKLSRGLYSSPQMFIANMRTLLSNSMDFGENKFRRAAGRYLYNYLEELLSESSPTLAPCVLPVQKLEVMLGNVSSMLKNMEKEEAPHQAREIATCALQNQPEEITAEVLRDDLALLGSSDKILKVAGFISAKQPDCVLMDTSLHFDFGLMTPEMRCDLHNYIMSLVQRLASGEI